MEKYHVRIRSKDDNRIVWRFTDKAVDKAEAEKVADDNKEGLNNVECYISIEKE